MHYFGNFSGSGTDVTYTDKNGATINLGGWKIGDTADKMTFQEFAYKLLHDYSKPIVNVVLNTDELHEKGVPIKTGVKITTNITKKTEGIKSIKFYVNDTMVKEITEGVADGGNFTYDHNVIVDTDTTFKVVVNDGIADIPSEQKVRFILPIYIGFVEDVAVADSDTVLGLRKVLQTSKNASLTGENWYSKAMYAYPKAMGNLTKIIGGMFDYITDFDVYTVNIKNNNYNVYMQKNASKIDNSLTYLFS